MSEQKATTDCPNCKTPIPEGSTFCHNCGGTVYPRGRPRRATSIWVVLICWIGIVAFGLVGGCGVYVAVAALTGRDQYGFGVIGLVFAALCLPVAALCIWQLVRIRRRNGGDTG